MQTQDESGVVQFGRGCAALKHQLERDADLNSTERLYIENSFTMLELCYVAWRRRKNLPSAALPPPPSMPSSGTSDSGSLDA